MHNLLIHNKYEFLQVISSREETKAISAIVRITIVKDKIGAGRGAIVIAIAIVIVIGRKIGIIKYIIIPISKQKQCEIKLQMPNIKC